MTLPSGDKFTIGEKDFQFSVASTGMELITGLKGVDDLGDFDGMLFDFGTSTKAIMTPKGLRFPIDVAFIREDGTVVQIERLDPALGMLRFANEAVRYALEVPVGFFEENNVAVGTIFNPNL